MTAIGSYRNEIVSKVGPKVVKDIEGRWKTVLKYLAEKNIHVLSRGPIESYFPCFTGNLFAPTAKTKKNAIERELEVLQGIQESASSDRETKLAHRYSGLYSVAKNLPSKEEVNLDGTLRMHLIDYVHQLQKAIKSNPGWTNEQIQDQMSNQPLARSGVVSLDGIQKWKHGGFEATLIVAAMLGQDKRTLKVDSNTTIENMGAFTQC